MPGHQRRARAGRADPDGRGARRARSSIGGIALHLRGEVRDVFMDWLRAYRPDLVERYEELYARGAYAPSRAQRRRAPSAAGATAAAEPARRRARRDRDEAVDREVRSRAAGAGIAADRVLTIAGVAVLMRVCRAAHIPGRSAQGDRQRQQTQLFETTQPHAGTRPASPASSARGASSAPGSRSWSPPPLIAGVLLLYHTATTSSASDMPIRAVTVVALLILGWALARDIGRALGPVLFRRMDPGTAGHRRASSIRLSTVLRRRCVVALRIAGLRAADARRRWRLHRGDRRSRRPADARQPLRRASSCSARGRSASAIASACRAAAWPGRSRASSARSGLLYTTFAQRRGLDHGPQQRRARRRGRRRCASPPGSTCARGCAPDVTPERDPGAAATSRSTRRVRGAAARSRWRSSTATRSSCASPPPRSDAPDGPRLAGEVLAAVADQTRAPSTAPPQAGARHRAR